MYRRHFVAGLGVAGTALSAPVIASAQSTRVLNIASIFGTGDTGRAAAARDLAARVGLLSGGALTIQVSDATADTAALHGELTGGGLDGVIGTEDLWTPLSPAFGLFASVPGGMMERELEAWIRAERGQERWDALAGEFGMKSLLLGDAGGEMLWSARALDDADAIAGLPIAARGLAALAWAEAGAEVTTVTGTESFPGGVEAYETGPLNEQYADRANAPARLYLDTPTRPSSALSLSMSRVAWDGLDDAQRRIVEAAAIAITHRTNARSMQASALAHQALRLSPALTIAPLPQPAWDAVMEASRAAFETLGDLDGEGRAAWRAYTRFARDVQNWTRLSEAAFTTARSRNLPS